MFVLCRDVARAHPSATLSLPAVRRTAPHATFGLSGAVAGNLRSIASPATIHMPPPAPRRIAITIADSIWARTHRHVSAYESCPLRFFYTHVLGIGTARRTTPFERTTPASTNSSTGLRRRGVGRVARPEGRPGRVRCDLEDQRPADSAYVADYRALAGTIVEGLIRAGAGRRFREASPLAINYRNGKVIVTPDEIAERHDGVIVVRKVRTGKRGKTEFGKLEYSLYQERPREHFGPEPWSRPCIRVTAALKKCRPPKVKKAGDNDSRENPTRHPAGLFRSQSELIPLPALSALLHLRRDAKGPLAIA